MNLDKKKEIVNDLHERFSKSTVVILTENKGLNVAQTSDLRRKLRNMGVDYCVVKNTLLNRASEGTGVACIRDYFKGPSAVAMSYQDPVTAAKVLTDFIKDNEKLGVRVGVLGGKVLNLDAIKALSALPSREVLLSKLLSVMNAVPTGLVRVLSGVPVKMLNVLNAIKDQKEKATS
ncbi:MAG: 50S ribosomal protein L10 [Desulfobacteraceae bacterium IS3]|jgi:large subunit ribosomal protein L10|nr:MAG: 50S ribosomal protein L10 [Desulfobacteraceae bacterium IS3]HAO22041.1 50S ribosomal protein L10 [Desulfobacteraceae bacterium]